MRRAWVVAAALLLLACGPEAEVAIPAPRVPDPTEPCRSAAIRPVNVVILAKEAVPEELAGLDYFVQSWGSRGRCFKGVVVTALGGAEPSQFNAVLVDISHDQVLSPADATALTAFRRAGRRIGLFGWPLRLDDRSVIADPLDGARAIFSDPEFHIARGCGDWQFRDSLNSPFPLGGGSYRYENFGGAIFTVASAGPQRSLATTLFCGQDPGPVMIETGSGIVAGFSLAYSISLADNNIRAVNIKQMVVDVLQLLVQPGPAAAG